MRELASAYLNEHELVLADVEQVAFDVRTTQCVAVDACSAQRALVVYHTASVL